MIIDISKMKYMIAAFWVSLLSGLGSGIYITITGKQGCFLCLIERFLITTIAAFCWVAKWKKGLKKFSIFFCVILCVVSFYHCLLIFGILENQKFCSLPPENGVWLEKFWIKLKYSCDQSSPFFAVSIFLIGLTVLGLLYVA